jgi:hypothetical protein
MDRLGVMRENKAIPLPLKDCVAVSPGHCKRSRFSGRARLHAGVPSGTETLCTDKGFGTQAWQSHCFGHSMRLIRSFHSRAMTF